MLKLASRFAAVIVIGLFNAGLAQPRYGFSFNNFFDASKSFLQVIAGIHLGVL